MRGVNARWLCAQLNKAYFIEVACVPVYAVLSQLLVFPIYIPSLPIYMFVPLYGY